MKKKTIYIARDGAIFESPAACKGYESRLPKPTYKIIEYTKEPNIILVQTVGRNGGKPNQTYQFSVDANIYAVQRLSDGKIFLADNTLKRTKAGSKFYLSGFWYNTALKTVCACGSSYKDGSYFSCNAATLEDLE